MARQMGLLDKTDDAEDSVLDRYALLDNIMDAVCEIHTGCAAPYCMIEQIYNKETGETRYNVLETYSEVDTIFSSSFSANLSIQYSDETFATYDKAHTPIKIETKSKKTLNKAIKSPKKKTPNKKWGNR